jgi:hypothetical protein
VLEERNAVPPVPLEERNAVPPVPLGERCAEVGRGLHQTVAAFVTVSAESSLQQLLPQVLYSSAAVLVEHGG